MFYCDECAKEKGLRIMPDVFKWLGACEICNKIGGCNDGRGDVVGSQKSYYKDVSMHDTKQLHIYVSECCDAGMVETDLVKISDGEGGETYYYAKCRKCDSPCNSKLHRVFDSNGVEIGEYDIVECPGVSLDCAWRYHAAFKDDTGVFQIRDLGYNNLNGYYLKGDYFNIGPYWNHLDKLNDEQLERYYNMSKRDIARMRGKERK